MDLIGTLGEEKQSPQKQNEITAGDRMLPHRQQRGGETQHPAQRKEQSNAHEHGQSQAYEPRRSPLLQRQFVDQNGDKNDVVNAEHDLEQSERQKPYPEVWFEKPIHTPSNPPTQK